MVTALLGLLGLRSFRGGNVGAGQSQRVDVAQRGRGTAVGGNVNHGAVITGDNNRVSLEFTGDVTYDYSDVAPTSPEPDELESTRRRLEELPLEEVPDRGPLPSSSVMSLRTNPYFVGRLEELKRIAANLKTGDVTTIGEVVVAASSGLGGVGKTQLASEFVHRYGRYFHSVYWLSFADPGSVPAEVASCGGTGGMNLRLDFHALPLEERVRAVMAEWQSELPRLLVFDNCEDEGLLDRWLPPTGGCRILITSRRGSWDEALGVTNLPLDVLERSESVALLREHRPDLPADDSDLDAIAEELGDLPLALDLAGRHLDKYRRDLTPSTYLADLRRPELLEHPSLRRARGISPTRHDMDVWRTFFLSYRRLDQANDNDAAAVRLLARAACFAPGEPIPRELFGRALAPPDADAETTVLATRVQVALERLTGVGLLTEERDETFGMHRLVTAFALAEIADEEAQSAAESAVGRAALDPSVRAQPVKSLILMPHLRHVTASSQDREDETSGLVCYALGVNLHHVGSDDEAVPYAERGHVGGEDLPRMRPPAPSSQQVTTQVVRGSALHHKQATRHAIASDPEEGCR